MREIYKSSHPRESPQSYKHLINIYKAYVTPHLDYGDVIYDNSSNASLSQMIQSVQYNAALAITGAIRGSSRETLYHDLGL